MGPQAVNAGISGDGVNVDANIPISDPKNFSVSAKKKIADGILSGKLSLYDVLLELKLGL